jgi:hypothetical protein
LDYGTYFVQAKGGKGLVEYLFIQTGMNEGAEQHVAADSGKAVEIGDVHGMRRGTCY